VSFHLWICLQKGKGSVYLGALERELLDYWIQIFLTGLNTTLCSLTPDEGNGSSFRNTVYVECTPDSGQCSCGRTTVFTDTSGPSVTVSVLNNGIDGIKRTFPDFEILVLSVMESEAYAVVAFLLTTAFGWLSDFVFFLRI
jgi:hypothetical protein